MLCYRMVSKVALVEYQQTLWTSVRLPLTKYGSRSMQDGEKRRMITTKLKILEA